MEFKVKNMRWYPAEVITKMKEKFDCWVILDKRNYVVCKQGARRGLSTEIDSLYQCFSMVSFYKRVGAAEERVKQLYLDYPDNTFTVRKFSELAEVGYTIDEFDLDIRKIIYDKINKPENIFLTVEDALKHLIEYRAFLSNKLKSIPSEEEIRIQLKEIEAQVEVLSNKRSDLYDIDREKDLLLELNKKHTNTVTLLLED